MIVLSSSLSFCCEQEDLCADNELTSCENEKPPKSHQEDSPCSPFFECGNCTGNILINTPLIEFNDHLEKSNDYSPFLETYLKKESHFRLLKPPMQKS